jgi:hypothetical protein
MTDYCINLNLDIEPIDGLETLHNCIKDSTEYVHYHSTLNLNSKYIIFLAKLGLVIDHIEIFHSVPELFTPIHSDVSQVPFTKGDIIKLNYVYGGKNSVMNWWKVNEGVTHTVSLNSREDNTGGMNSETIKGEAHNYKLEDLTWLHSSAIGHPSIVQVGIPHNIQNREEERYCLSVVLLKDGKRLTMSDAKAIFAQYIIA